MEGIEPVELTLPDESGPLLINQTDVARKRTITAGQLALLTYFCTSGSPFGVESAVLAGGPLLTLLGSLAVILVFSFPQGLVAAELSTMMNDNGGSVIWVQIAFGDFVGYINAHSNFLCLATSQSILLNLFITYLSVMVEFGYWQSTLTSFLFVVLVCNINLVGVGWVSKLSVVFFIFIFSPFFAEMGWMIHTHPAVDWGTLLQVPAFHEIQWGLLISTLVWSNGGYDIVGAVAGEVTTPKSFLLGLIVALPIGLINYVFPLILGYLTFPYYPQWNGQSFAWIAVHKFPSFIGIWMICATAVSSFAPFTSITATLSRTVWAMAIGRDGGLGEHRYFPYFLSYSYRKPNGEVVPITATILCCLLPFFLSLLPTSFIIQLFLVLRVVTVFLEYGACIYLKYTKPEADRPFNIPGGVLGTVILFAPTVAIIVAAMATSDTEVLIYGSGALVLIVCSYSVKLAWVWVTHKYNCCRHSMYLPPNK